ncbi:hypothetical protein HAX54_036344, partial [Datura stramonium]|nr:hypothetical protein [Datura stramonium]
GGGRGRSAMRLSLRQSSGATHHSLHGRGVRDVTPIAPCPRFQPPAHLITRSHVPPSAFSRICHSLRTLDMHTHMSVKQ